MILEKNQQIDQWSRIDSAERDTHKKSNGSLTKDQRQYNAAKIVFPQMVLEKLDIHVQNKLI